MSIDYGTFETTMSLTDSRTDGIDVLNAQKAVSRMSFISSDVMMPSSAAFETAVAKSAQRIT